MFSNLNRPHTTLVKVCVCSSKLFAWATTAAPNCSCSPPANVDWSYLSYTTDPNPKPVKHSSSVVEVTVALEDVIVDDDDADDVVVEE